MKNRKGIAVFIPIVITLSMYLVFYSKIETKPTDAGFWLILALGISVGAILCKLFNKKSNKSESQ